MISKVIIIKNELSQNFGIAHQYLYRIFYRTTLMISAAFLFNVVINNSKF